MHIFMDQGPNVTSPGHVTWLTLHKMATKLNLDLQKSYFRHNYVHFSAYNSYHDGVLWF